MGKNGLEKLLKGKYLNVQIIDRKDNLLYMKERLKELANKYNERVLDTPKNTISIGFTLQNIAGEFYEENEEKNNVKYYF